MKDLSFFFLKKYSLASRMRGRASRGAFASSCGGDGSTSTLNQHQKIDMEPENENIPFGGGSPRTLEEMILQLEVEEDIVRRARLRESYYGAYNNCDDDDADDDTLYHQPVRMSCVNSSDILRCVMLRYYSCLDFEFSAYETIYVTRESRLYSQGVSANFIVFF